jgi:hypothetical protein
MRTTSAPNFSQSPEEPTTVSGTLTHETRYPQQLDGCDVVRHGVRRQGPEVKRLHNLSVSVCVNGTVGALPNPGLLSIVSVTAPVHAIVCSMASGAWGTSADERV